MLVRQRPSKGLLAGLWEFPNSTTTEVAHSLAPEILISSLDVGKTSQDYVWRLESTLKRGNASMENTIFYSTKFCGSVQHIFSHRKHTYHVFDVQFSPPEALDHVLPFKYR